MITSPNRMRAWPMKSSSRNGIGNKAEANYRRSLALDPNYATAHEWYAIFLAAMRRSDEAVKEIDRALELDPLSLAVNYNAGSIYLQAGRNAEALGLAQKSLEIDPSSTPAHLTLAAVYERTVSGSDRRVPKGKQGRRRTAQLYAYGRALLRHWGESGEGGGGAWGLCP